MECPAPPRSTWRCCCATFHARPIPGSRWRCASGGSGSGCSTTSVPGELDFAVLGLAADRDPRRGSPPRHACWSRTWSGWFRGPATASPAGAPRVRASPRRSSSTSRRATGCAKGQGRPWLRRGRGWSGGVRLRGGAGRGDDPVPRPWGPRDRRAGRASNRPARDRPPRPAGPGSSTFHRRRPCAATVSVVHRQEGPESAAGRAFFELVRGRASCPRPPERAPPAPDPVRKSPSGRKYFGAKTIRYRKL